MEGILPLWKERGMTSHDCVFKLRKILKTKKIGHTGTLDPDVDGVLPICVGSATKVVEYMMETGKAYVGEITIGFSTTTEDVSGEVVDSVQLAQGFSTAEIDEAMKKLTGTITQIPPMYSAVKVNGKRLYEYARNGESVERPQRQAEINSFVRTSEPIFDEVKGTQSWRFEVYCGKGTYVRTLAVDTGSLLGVPAHMSDLTRILSGTFKAGDCLTLAQVEERQALGMMAEKLFPLEYGLKEFPFVALTEAEWEKVRNGAVFLANTFVDRVASHPFVVTYLGQACAIYDQHPSKPHLLKPIKVIKTQIEVK